MELCVSEVYREHLELCQRDKAMESRPTDDGLPAPKSPSPPGTVGCRALDWLVQRLQSTLLEQLGDLLPQSQSANQPRGARQKLPRFQRHRWWVTEWHFVAVSKNHYIPLVGTEGLPCMSMPTKSASHLQP